MASSSSSLLLPQVFGGPKASRHQRAAERRRIGIEFLTCCPKAGRMDRLAGGTATLLPGSKLERGLAEAAALLEGSPAGTVGAAGVAVACCPLPVVSDLLSALAPAQQQQQSEQQDEEAQQPSIRMHKLQKYLSASCIAQLAFAGLDFSLNDPFVGLLGASVAALGIRASTVQGYRYLPSYIVLSFCNGSMQVLLGAEFFATLAKIGLAKTAALPLGSNPLFLHLLSMASPGLMFVGLYFAYQLHRELRTLQAEVTAYTAPYTAPLARTGRPSDDVPVPNGGVHFRFFEGQSHSLVSDEEEPTAAVA